MRNLNNRTIAPSNSGTLQQFFFNKELRVVVYSIMKITVCGYILHNA